MQSPEPFRIFTRKLHELGLRYMVSGSVAAIYYGEPRMLQFFKEGGSGKHLRDINRMVVSLGAAWDRGDLEEMIYKYSLGSEWQMATAADHC